MTPATPRRPVHPKVKATFSASSLTTLLVFAAGLLHLDLPPLVAAALVGVLATAAGYWRRA